MQRKQFSLQQTGGGIMIQFCVYSRHLEEWGWCWDSWNPRAVLGSSWPVGSQRYISEWRSWVYSCTCKLGVRPLLFLIFHQTDGCKLYFYCLYIHLTIWCLWQRNRLCHFKRWVLRWSFDCYFRRMRAYAHQSHQSWKQNWPSKLESYVYTEISCFVM